MARKDEIDWNRARILWEADPKLSQAALARMINVSKEAVSKRCRSEKWTKIDKQREVAKVVRHRAQQRADERTTDVPSQNPAHEDPGPFLTEHPEAPPPAEVGASLGVDTAVEMRAQILERHRREWNGARNHVYKAIQGADFEKAKLGKITAEAIKIIQDGERKAWGLDNDEKVVKLGYEDGKDIGW